MCDDSLFEVSVYDMICMGYSTNTCKIYIVLQKQCLCSPINFIPMFL